MPARILPKAGDQFGRLTFTGKAKRLDKGRFLVCECTCACGYPKRFYRIYGLRDGTTQSCGCLRRDHIKAAVTFHGCCGRPEYNVWRQMKARCLNKNHRVYRHYGGRCISVCERCAVSFQAFFNDVGPRPTSNHTIERVNNDGNYEPSNVVWASRLQQSRNTRSVRNIELGEQTLCFAELAERALVSRSVLFNRLKRGIPPELAIQDFGPGVRWWKLGYPAIK